MKVDCRSNTTVRSDFLVVKLRYIVELGNVLQKYHTGFNIGNREIRFKDGPNFQYHPLEYCVAVRHKNLHVVLFLYK